MKIQRYDDNFFSLTNSKLNSNQFDTYLMQKSNNFKIKMRTFRKMWKNINSNSRWIVRLFYGRRQHDTWHLYMENHGEYEWMSPCLSLSLSLSHSLSFSLSLFPLSFSFFFFLSLSLSHSSLSLSYCVY